MSAMLCIGGGVLLCTVFVHMIPEVRENIERARKLGVWGAGNQHDDHDHDQHDHAYPLAELIVCAGFFIIYFIEAAVNKVFGLQHGHGHGHSHKHPEKGFKNELQVAENGGLENLGFNDSGMVAEGPLRSPPDTPNTTDGTMANKTICSPVTCQDNHPDNVDATISPFGFKYRY